MMHGQNNIKLYCNSIRYSQNKTYFLCQWIC